MMAYPDDRAAADRDVARGLWTALTVMALALLVFVAASTAGGSVAAAPTAALAQDEVAMGAEVFSDTCARCHEPGGVGVIGEVPPLLGNPNGADPDYVETVVREGLSGPIEVLGVSYNDSMRAFGDLSDEEISAVVAYVGSLAVRGSGTGDAPVEVEPGTVDEGRALFVGSARLDNGGAACVACHTAGKVGNLGGWSLGPDLTETSEVFGGEDPLAAWLSDPASATMEPIFVEHPLTANEIADLAAFLGDAPSQTKPSDPGDSLILAGGVGFLILIGGMAFVWRGMRQTYVERLRSRR